MTASPAKSGSLVVHLVGPREASDWLVAELGEIGFGAFQDEPGGIAAYLDEALWDQVQASLPGILKRTGFEISDSRRIAAQNWNAEWERGIEPVSAGGFYVHPPWHPAKADAVSICIEPKMSFGTAHHATTRLVLGAMEEIVTSGDAVMDAGTGTGVLAIAAAHLGASSVVAFDIDPWSEENTRENLERNSISGVDVRFGGLDVAGEGPFDVILANINLNALREMIPGFVQRSAPGAKWILSGVLEKDRTLIEDALRAGKCPVREVRQEGEWISVIVDLGR